MKITEKLFLELYEQGLKDSEISRISGDSASTNMVYIPSKEYSKFKELISPYIIDSMKYKL